MWSALRDVPRVEGYYRNKTFSLSHTSKDTTPICKCGFCCNVFKSNHMHGVCKGTSTSWEPQCWSSREEPLWEGAVKKVAKACRHFWNNQWQLHRILTDVPGERQRLVVMKISSILTKGYWAMDIYATPHLILTTLCEVCTVRFTGDITLSSLLPLRKLYPERKNKQNQLEVGQLLLLELCSE